MTTPKNILYGENYIKEFYYDSDFYMDDNRPVVFLKTDKERLSKIHNELIKKGITSQGELKKYEDEFNKSVNEI